MKKALFATLALLVSTQSFAKFMGDDELYDLDPLITDNNLQIAAEFGALLTSGNNESQSILGKVTVEYDLKDWRHKYTFDALYRESEKDNKDTGESVLETTAEKYILNAESNYKFTDESAIQAFLGYESDRFGAYASTLTIAVGYNWRALDMNDMTLDLNIAPGYTSLETNDGEEDSAPAARGSAAYSWKISNSAKFNQNLSVESSTINTRLVAESAMISKITGSMQMKVGFKAIHNDTVDANKVKTDTESSVTLIVNF